MAGGSEGLGPPAFLISDLLCRPRFYGVQQQRGEAAVLPGAVPVVAGTDELFPTCEQLHAIEGVAVFAAYGGHQHGLAARVAFPKGMDLIELSPVPGDRRDKRLWGKVYGVAQCVLELGKYSCGLFLYEASRWVPIGDPRGGPVVGCKVDDIAPLLCHRIFWNDAGGAGPRVDVLEEAMVHASVVIEVDGRGKRGRVIEDNSAHARRYSVCFGNR